ASGRPVGYTRSLRPLHEHLVVVCLKRFEESDVPGLPSNHIAAHRLSERCIVGASKTLLLLASEPLEKKQTGFVLRARLPECVIGKRDDREQMSIFQQEAAQRRAARGVARVVEYPIGYNHAQAPAWL